MYRSQPVFSTLLSIALASTACVCAPDLVHAQTVGLPAPRLLTTLPMGGQIGTTFEVTITGEQLNDSDAILMFSAPGISAVQKTTENGEPVPNKYLVTVAGDAKPGVVDARMMTKLGVSSARAFTVGTQPEVTRTVANTTLEKAMKLQINSVCNAFTTGKAIDHYQFETKKGTRLIVECAAVGIDSKLVPVLIIADEKGRDLAVDRRGGLLDFTAPQDGIYHIKVHGMTYQGGAECFYRLSLISIPTGESIPRQPTTLAVNTFSTPAEGNSSPEAEPNNKHSQAQKITLPCDIAGKFFPAADVDTFEFNAKKSEEWWIEVVSERTGLGTNPFVVVQRVITENGQEQLADVLELNDIASPVKVSSNGYSYDGPPYQSGSSDSMGKLLIPEDGTYRLQLRDLYGGTRTDPRNVYRLIVRKAKPDFALATWAMHMTLRNGDRYALSKPLALRPGSTVAFDVVVIRKDGFNGEIEVGMTDLPAGVSAVGLTIPAGKSSGTLLITAKEDSPPVFGVAKVYGRSTIDGAVETRNCVLASMAWPVRDASGEIPNPRLMADVPVSIGEAEPAPLTIKAAEEKVWTAKAGETLTIPLTLTWRGEFSGSLKLKAFASGLTGVKEIEVPLTAPKLEAVLDLAQMKAAPGDYTLVYYGGVVSKYRERLDRLKLAEERVETAQQQLAELTKTSEKAAADVKAAAEDQKAAAEKTATEAAEAVKLATKAKTDADAALKTATTLANAKEIADIVVAEPIRIHIEAGTSP